MDKPVHEKNILFAFGEINMLKDDNQQDIIIYT